MKLSVEKLESLNVISGFIYIYILFIAERANNTDLKLIVQLTINSNFHPFSITTKLISKN